MSRPIYEIAREIRSSWGEKVHFAAKPWLEALLSLHSVRDWYGMDSADTCVLYFLSNATGWRGEDARRLKKELKELLKEVTK